MHNIIKKKQVESNVIDHINHNTLDNRKCNLREISKEENATNICINLKSKTGVRNVTIENGRYRVRINGRSFGSYLTLEEAVEVANRERQKIFKLSNTEDEKVRIL